MHGQRLPTVCSPVACHVVSRTCDPSAITLPLQASRLMVRHAAAALDSRSPGATLDCAMAKRFATDACFNVTNDALQLLGGYG